MEIERAINKVAKAAAENKEGYERDRYQRRNQVTDLFGVEQSAQGDSDHPATFYVSVSPDLLYYERFEFKLIFSPFVMPIAGGGTSSTSLTVSNDTITPNPHSHDLKPGISLFESKVSNVRVVLDDVDLTDALKKQFNGAWINGEGVYPSGDSATSNYDVLRACSDLWLWQTGVVLNTGYKKLQVYGDGVFNVKLVLYLKHSHVNR